MGGRITPIVVLLFIQIQAFSQANNPEELAKWYDKGKEKQADEEYLEAAKLFVKALSYCPKEISVDKESGNDCVNCHYNIGVCASELEKWESAENAFTNVLEYNPEDHEAFAKRAKARTERGNHEGALSDMENALAIIHPDWNTTDDYYRVWYTHDLAIAYREVGKYEEAIKYLNKAIELDNNTEYRLERAKLLYKIGRLGDLEKDLEILEDAGMVDELNFERGVVHMYNTRYKEAIPFFSEVKSEDNIPFAIRNLTLCYIRLNKLSLAKSQISQLETLGYRKDEIAWLKSQVHTKEGDWESAIDWADEAESLMEDESLQYYLALQRANIHFRKGNFRDAIGEAGLVQSSHPLYPEAITLKALAHLQVVEQTEAGKVLIEEQGMHPDNPLVQGRLAWFLFRTGKKEEGALRLLELAREFPTSPEINYFCAEANYQLQRFTHQECHIYLEKALDMKPEMEEAYVLKARLYFEQNRKGEAERLLGIAEQLGITHAYSTYNAASIYTREGKAELALARSSTSILREPNEPQFVRQYGITLFNNGLWKESIVYLDRVIENNPQDREAVKARGLSHMLSGASETASADFKRLDEMELFVVRGGMEKPVMRESQPDFVDAYIHYSRLFMNDMANDENYYNALNMLDKALFEAGQVVNSRPGRVYNEVGLLKWRKGYLEEALWSFDDGIREDPTYILYENRARLHYEMGNYEAADSDKRKSLELKQKK